MSVGHKNWKQNSSETCTWSPNQDLLSILVVYPKRSRIFHKNGWEPSGVGWDWSSSIWFYTIQVVSFEIIRIKIESTIKSFHKLTYAFVVACDCMRFSEQLDTVHLATAFLSELVLSLKEWLGSALVVVRLLRSSSLVDPWLLLHSKNDQNVTSIQQKWSTVKSN